jgi:HNH endonuclease
MSRLAERHHGKPCGYCQRPMDKNSETLSATRDHTVPRCRGGSKSAIVICCRKCNGLKGDMLPAEWAAYMTANPGWWQTREQKRAEKWKVRRKRRELQGYPPPGPVVVPPELIYRTGPIPIAESLFILQHGKKAYRAALEDGQFGPPDD